MFSQNHCMVVHRAAVSEAGLPEIVLSEAVLSEAVLSEAVLSEAVSPKSVLPKSVLLKSESQSKASAQRISREDAPRDLRTHNFELDGREYVVLSFESAQAPRLAGLSKAETEVVRAALAGLTNEEIAVTRGRSIFTIQNQLAAAWRKLGVSSRHEAAARLALLPET